MGLCGSYGVGQYTGASATEAHVAIYDRLYVPSGGARPVLWFHSAGGAAIEPWVASNNTLPHLAAIAANFRSPILSADCSPIYTGSFPQHWGNDTAQSRVNDMRAFIQSRFGASSARALLIGASMGGMLALNWARANPTLVAAIALLYPATSLQAIHDGTGGAGNGAATTEAAYGGSLANFNAAVAAHDPSQNASAYNGVPIKMWYSTADTTVGTANQTAFASAVPGTAFQTRSLGAVGHADMTQVSPGELVAFLQTYA